MRNRVATFTPYIAMLLVLISTAPVLYADAAHGTAEEAQAMVARAIAYFDEVGAEKAYDKFTNDPQPEFRDRDLYVFVFTGDGTLAAHGVDPSLVGKNMIGVEDADGTDIGSAIINAASAEGAWVDYKWLNPDSGKVADKASWVVLHKGYTFGTGIYKP